MSRTIVTKNNIEFFTNINSEQLIGKLCKKVNAKHFSYKYSNNEDISMSYDMTNEECIDTSQKLRTLIDKTDQIYSDYKIYFSKDSTSDTLKEFIINYSDIFEKCGGYECLG